MKHSNNYQYIFLILIYFTQTSVLLSIEKSLLHKTAKLEMRNIVRKLKEELNEYKNINAKLKLLDVRGSKINKSKFVNPEFDLQEELVIDFKISNKTIINDMDIILKQFNNNSEILNSKSDDQNCIIKINITENPKYSSNMNITRLHNNTNITSITNYNSYNLNEPQKKDLKIISDYLISLNKTLRDTLCLSCLNQLEFMNFLIKEVGLITTDMFSFVSKTNSKQDLIAKISDQINKVNLVKINLNYIHYKIDLLNSSKCHQADENYRFFQRIKKKSNNLVEAIQNSIRKTNLNVNFLIIS